MDIFGHLIRDIRWQDIADIALNSYILFRFYILFRGTNVLRVLFGIAMVWFSQRIAVSVGLIVTSWISQGIIAAAAIIIIVIFRNEIRSVLQTKNIKAILWELPHKSIKVPIQIVVDSAIELAKQKIGALIVFPGREDLEEVVQKGISLQGSISKELILSIFWPGNPVHDGAAIIQGDRILEVGCILPLSRRSDLPSHYGTRHRAALGLSENTDALVIVISEERGDIQVAKGPHIRGVTQKGLLKNKLQQHLGLTAKDSTSGRKEKIEVGVAALISTLLIAAVWFSVSRGLDTLMTIAVPIEYLNRDPAKEIIDTSVNAIQLDLSGSGSLLKSIQPEQIRVKVDLSKSVMGQNTFTITHDGVTLPPGVLLKKVKPSVIKVTLDVIVNKELPIQVDWIGKLAEHLILVTTRLDPEKITLIGGKQTLEKLSTIYTEKIPLDNIDKSGAITAKLALNPASLRIAPNSKNRITINYVVKERLDKTLSNKPK